MPFFQFLSHFICCNSLNCYSCFSPNFNNLQFFTWKRNILKEGTKKRLHALRVRGEWYFLFCWQYVILRSSLIPTTFHFSVSQMEQTWGMAFSALITTYLLSTIPRLVWSEIVLTKKAKVMLSFMKLRNLVFHHLTAVCLAWGYEVWLLAIRGKNIIQ